MDHTNRDIRWEHRVVLVPFGGNPERTTGLLHQEMTKLEVSGWELVSAVYTGFEAYRLFFKRPVLDESD